MLVKKSMLFPVDVNVFYEVCHAMSNAGYKQVKNGSTVEECIYTKDLIDYKVVAAHTEGNDIVIEITETNDFDNEYLKNEVIEASYTIDRNTVLVESNSTTFARCKRHFSIDTTGAIADYKKLLKLCKANGIKLSYKNHYKKFLVENEVNYIDEIEKAHTLFNSLIDAAGKVEARKIRVGCNDDKYLNVMREIKTTYEKMFLSSGLINKYESIANRIKDYIEEIENGHDSYIKLYL